MCHTLQLDLLTCGTVGLNWAHDGTVGGLPRFESLRTDTGFYGCHTCFRGSTETSNYAGYRFSECFFSDFITTS